MVARGSSTTPRYTVVIAGLVLLLAAPALAQPAAKPAEPAARSPAAALALSLGGSVGSTVLFLGAVATLDRDAMHMANVVMVVVPSFGHWYANEPFSLGLGIRVVSGAAFAFALERSRHCGAGCSGGNNGIAAGALAGLAVGMIYDIATAPSAAESYNQRHGLRLTMAPTLLPARSGPGYGLALQGTF
jgi:hypothetical protein